jgi:hypothetical protein
MTKQEMIKIVMGLYEEEENDILENVKLRNGDPFTDPKILLKKSSPEGSKENTIWEQ